MRCSCCCQSFGQALAPLPHSPAARGASSLALARFVTEKIVRSALYVVAIIVVMAMLRVPLLAQENSVEMPAPVPQPQPPTLPSPQAGEGRVGGAPDFGSPRFVFHRIDGAFLRLDLLTGAIASCSRSAAEWTCVPGREERAALDREIARLQRDNAVLKNALLEYGVPLPSDMNADRPSAATVAPALPSEGGGERKGGGQTVPRQPQTVPPTAAVPFPPAKSGEQDRASHDDAEIEHVMVAMEKVWRRLIEIMMGIQRDLQKKG